MQSSKFSMALFFKDCFLFKLNIPLYYSIAFPQKKNPSQWKASVLHLFSRTTKDNGHAVAQLVETLRYKPEGRGFDCRWCHWNFSLTPSFRQHNGPGVDSASNRTEYQGYFLGVKETGAYDWQPYHLPVPIVLKSGILSLLEPSGPGQACTGITLPLLRTIHKWHTAC
jgi:hypothetical protein